MNVGRDKFRSIGGVGYHGSDTSLSSIGVEAGWPKERRSKPRRLEQDTRCFKGYRTSIEMIKEMLKNLITFTQKKEDSMQRRAEESRKKREVEETAKRISNLVDDFQRNKNA